MTNDATPVVTDYTGLNHRLWRLLQVGFNRYLKEEGKTTLTESKNGEGAGLPLYVKEYFDAADAASVIDFFANDAKFAWLGEYLAEVSGENLDTKEECTENLDAFINRTGVFAEKGKPEYWRPLFMKGVLGLENKLGPNDYMPVKWNWEIDDEKYFDNYWVSYWNVTNHDTEPGWYEKNGYEYAVVPSNWYNMNALRDTIGMTEDEKAKWGGNGLTSTDYALAWRNGNVSGNIVHHIEESKLQLYASYVEKRLQEDDQEPNLTINPYDASNDDVLSLLANDNYGETTHDIKMERTFISGAYDVICLPFVISREEQLPEVLIDAEIRKLYSVTKTIDNSGKSMAVLNFIKIDSPLDMQPGVPYLVKTEQDINTEYILFNQLTQADILVGEPLFETVDGVVFQGVYNPTTLPQGAYVIGEDNQLTTTSGTIKGYRGYFMIDVCTLL